MLRRLVCSLLLVAACDPPPPETIPDDLTSGDDLLPAADMAQPTTCYVTPVTPTCAENAPAPTDSDAIADFIRRSAKPIECGERTWDLRLFDELSAEHRLIMFGEIHGTNEIGQVSAKLFKRLAEQDRVNGLAIEFPMDFEEAFQHYVDTGSDPLVNSYKNQLAKNFFGRILPETALALTKAGHPIKMALVDTPYGTEVPVRAIQAIAAQLTTKQARVLTGLPAPKRYNEQMPSDYLTSAIAYHDGIDTDLADICTEATEAQCDELINMARAIWVVAQQRQGMPDEEAWFAMREQVIYFNYRKKFADENRRLYAHMGAFHTNKASMSSGSMLSQTFPGTKGKVFSVSIAVGEGSETYYGEVMDLPAMPAVIADALTDVKSDPQYVSTALPSAGCVQNPLTDAIDEFNGTVMGQTYDGYLHVRRVTPETSPNQSTLKQKGGELALLAQLAAERRAVEERVLNRRGIHLQLRDKLRLGPGFLRRTTVRP